MPGSTHPVSNGEHEGYSIDLDARAWTATIAGCRIRRPGGPVAARRTLKYLKNFLSGLIFACWTASAALGQVVITEIMYHPDTEVDGEEFIEIHNPTVTAIPLESWFCDGVTLQFQAGAEILPGEYLVLAPAGGQFEDRYGFPPYREYTDSGLSDNGERLALLDTGSVVVDEVTFDDGPPWSVTPAG